MTDELDDDLSDAEVKEAISKLAEDHIAKASGLLTEVNTSWLAGPPETVARATAIGALAVGHALTGLSLMIAAVIATEYEDDAP